MAQSGQDQVGANKKIISVWPLLLRVLGPFPSGSCPSPWCDWFWDRPLPSLNKTLVKLRPLQNRLARMDHMNVKVMSALLTRAMFSPRPGTDEIKKEWGLDVTLHSSAWSVWSLCQEGLPNVSMFLYGGETKSSVKILGDVQEKVSTSHDRGCLQRGKSFKARVDPEGRVVQGKVLSLNHTTGLKSLVGGAL